MPRVYVNALPIDAPDGSTATDAVRLWNADIAQSLVRGDHQLVDSRGLPTPVDAPVFTGAIYRVLPVRRAERDGQ